MKKFNIFLGIVISLLLVLYALFLFAVPNFINLNNYKSDIQKIVKDSIKLDLNFNKLYFRTTPSLGVKIYLDEVNLKYPSGKQILQVKSADIIIPLIPLLAKTFRISSITLKNPDISLFVDDKGHYDIEKYILSNLKTDSSEQKEDEQPLPVNISSDMPKILVNDYKVLITDEVDKSKSVVKGDLIKIEDFNIEKHIKVTADGDLSINNDKFISYDIKVSSFLPKGEETNENQSFDLSEQLFNPFKEIFQHKFHANVFADLKISQNGDRTFVNGDLNVDKIKFKSTGVMLPESYLKLKFKNEDIQINSDLYSAKDEKTAINGNFNFGKKSNINLSVKNKSVKISNLKSILIVILDVLNIDNDFANLNTEGYLTADFNVKTDFKKIQSSGKLQIKDAKISHKSLPVVINDIKALLNFSNNKIIISDTSAFINGSKLNISGTIDNTANADIKIITDKLPLTKLYQAFATPDIKKSYVINSGDLTLNAYIKGKMEKIAPYADLSLKNLSIKDKSLNANYSLASLTSKITTSDNKFNGDVSLVSGNVIIPDFNMKLNIPTSKIKISDKDIIINPTIINLDSSKLTFDGKISDYISNMTFDGVLKGNLNTYSLKSYLPKDIKSMTKNSGSLPMIALISSNGKTTQINAQVLANAQNYFSPIEIAEMKYHPTILNFDSSLTNDILSIKDIGLYSLNSNAILSNNLKTNISNSSQVAYVNGKILNVSSKNPQLSGVKIATVKNLSANIPTMKNSSATINVNVSADGNLSSPNIKGHVNVKNASIPEYMLKIKDLAISFDKNIIAGTCPELNLNGSLVAANFSAKNDFSKDFIINNLTINSSYLDLDKVLAIASNMPQSDYAPSAAIPVKILKGNGIISKFIMGDIEAANVSSNFTLNNNLLNLTNLKANAYQGTVSGSLSYNIPYLRITAKLSGAGLDANQAISAFMGLKNQIMGTLAFNADISMAGSTYTQQMRTLKGNANFNVQNGQMGNLGKLEYYLYAQNLVASKLFNINLNSILKTLSPKNTGKFSYLKGDLVFKNGYLYINPIVSSGPNMSLYMNGTFNLLNNIINLELLGRLSQDVHNSLGVVGDLSLSKLVSIGNTKFGTSVAAVMTKYNAQTSAAQLNKIPALTPSSSGTKEFAVQLNGNIESTTAVKSFKWLTTQDVASSASSVQMKVPSAVQTVTNQLQQVTSKMNNAVGSKPSSTATSGISTQKNVEIPDFLKALPDSFKPRGSD